eukprot:scaffold11752_cov20-Tisochrysis_lutea.AAC.3
MPYALCRMQFLVASLQESMPQYMQVSEQNSLTDVKVEIPCVQANHILLEKLINIKNFDSWSAFKPWLARSTFQYGPGTFYDPTTGHTGMRRCSYACRCKVRRSPESNRLSQPSVQSCSRPTGYSGRLLQRHAAVPANSGRGVCVCVPETGSPPTPCPCKAWKRDLFQIDCGWQFKPWYPFPLQSVVLNMRITLRHAGKMPRTLQLNQEVAGHQAGHHFLRTSGLLTHLSAGLLRNT